MPDDISESDALLNENPTGNPSNNKVTTVQGPTGDDNDIESWKVWTMEIPMNGRNIWTTMTSGLKQASGDYKKYLCRMATH